jgi:hypothetical protein
LFILDLLKTVSFYFSSGFWPRPVLLARDFLWGSIAYGHLENDTVQSVAHFLSSGEFQTKETLNKSFDKLRKNAHCLIPFVASQRFSHPLGVSLSNPVQSTLNQRFPSSLSDIACRRSGNGAGFAKLG